MGNSFQEHLNIHNLSGRLKEYQIHNNKQYSHYLAMYVLHEGYLTFIGW